MPTRENMRMSYALTANPRHHYYTSRRGKILGIGLHVTAGLIWLTALAVYLIRHGFSDFFTRRLTMFTMFWHFLDIIWIFIFMKIEFF